MTDEELVKHCMCGCMYLEPECPNCNKITDADRIEALTKERDQWRRAAETRAEGWKISDDARIEAEIKLAKAVEVLSSASNMDVTDWSEALDVKNQARATLAELTGGKDE